MIATALICTLPIVWVLATAIVRHQLKAPDVVVGNLTLID
jgi:hypothetical protein